MPLLATVTIYAIDTPLILRYAVAAVTRFSIIDDCFDTPPCHCYHYIRHAITPAIDIYTLIT